MHPTLTTAAALFLVVSLASQEPQSRPVAESRPASLPVGSSEYPLHGRSELKYVGRWTAGADDHDLFNSTDLDLGDARRHLLTAHVAGRLALDLDRDRSPGNPFRTVDDTYSKDLTARLYSAYLDVNGGVDGSPMRGVINRVRAGRQILYETPRTLFLDGVSVETAPARLMELTFIGYVGSPSHLFEQSRDGDWAAGGAVSAVPWRGGQVRFDYLHVTDRYLSTTNEDDLFALRGEQVVGKWLRLGGNFSMLETEAHEVGAHATVEIPDAELSLTGRYTGLLSDQNERTLDLDYFHNFLATYFAYDQYELAVHKGLGEHAFVDGGVQFRELRHDDNAGIFNHEFQRYYLTPGISEWPFAGFSISLTGAAWVSGGDRFGSVGAEAQQRFDDAWTGSIGTAFDLYRYDALLGQERQDVQTSWARLTWRATKHLRLRGSFTFEDGDDADFYTVLLSVEVRQ